MNMMRRLLIAVAAGLLICAPTQARTPRAGDFKALFDAVQSLGAETELRADIADRLGFGEQPLPIVDLVITKDGVQHALNAFVVSGKPYILFNSHLYVPQIYLFVKDIDGALVAGIHGRQYQPITATRDMTPTDIAQVVGAEEAFWFQWLADGAKPPN